LKNLGHHHQLVLFTGEARNLVFAHLTD